MDTAAVVFERPGALDIKQLTLRAANPDDAIVEVMSSGVSTGTEKMLFQGTMPRFPGMGYPLVPGYESIGQVIAAGPESGVSVGETVFVPGANCFMEAAGLFGATASRLVVPGARLVAVSPDLADDGVLLALAATAHHAILRAGQPVSLVIGHGVLGRLIARIIIALGDAAPTVWETNPLRRTGADSYAVIDPADDDSGPHGAVIDASGNPAVIDAAIARLAKGGELVLAGFYGERIGFDFAPAFMREIAIAIAAEFKPDDIAAVLALTQTGRLSLKGLVTHHAAPAAASRAYDTAFNDPGCLKMVIDWRKSA